MALIKNQAKMKNKDIDKCGAQETPKDSQLFWDGPNYTKYNRQELGTGRVLQLMVNPSYLGMRDGITVQSQLEQKVGETLSQETSRHGVMSVIPATQEVQVGGSWSEMASDKNTI
jgi:hypothetical protein